MSKNVQLGDIAKIYSGGTPSRANLAYWGGAIPWVKTTQIQNCHIKESDIDEWITKEGLEHSSAKMVPEGTIVIAMYGQGKTRGQVAILGLDAAINQACAAIQLHNGINRDFVYQQLRFRYSHIRSLSNSGSQDNLSAGLVREIQFHLPPLVQQTAIAELLSTWDAAIEKIEKLIAAKERQLAGIIQHFMGRNANEGQGWPEVYLGEYLQKSSARLERRSLYHIAYLPALDLFLNVKNGVRISLVLSIKTTPTLKPVRQEMIWLPIQCTDHLLISLHRSLPDHPKHLMRFVNHPFFGLFLFTRLFSRARALIWKNTLDMQLNWLATRIQV